MFFERFNEVDDVGWPLTAIVLSTGAAFFFSLHKLILQMFSKVRLSEAYKEADMPNRSDEISDNDEKLVMVCSLYWRLANICIFISLLWFLYDGNGAIKPMDFLFLFVAAAIISIFNLVVPFAWAKYSGEYILMRTYPFLKFVVAMAKPLDPVFKLNDIIVKRLSGHAESTPEEEQEERHEEFLTVVEEQMMDGVVDQQEQIMIKHVLELDETTAEEIMTPRTDMVAIEVNSDFNKVIEVITNAGHSRIPVYEENIDKIIGMVYAKDMLKMFGQNAEKFDLRDHIRKAFFVPETKILNVLLNEFKARNLHIAVVLDEYGGTAGIVTIEDILEEVVGEIEDEYETPAPKSIYVIDDNTADVDARINIDELNSELDIDLPEDEDYDTLGGFVFSYLGYIPEPNEEFEYDNVRFRITEAQERSVKRLTVQKLPKLENGNGNGSK